MRRSDWSVWITRRRRGDGGGGAGFGTAEPHERMSRNGLYLVLGALVIATVVISYLL